ncbi:hypothetical protein D1224_08735 [Henriciella barbarensis]|uniref:DUF2946 domain-containing protein n=1 Tax=Henriciella barbarensis TaxID=86342 RepID=A0A399R0J1_9PROT|nr:hypothetical protein [Henriciella barbarensis]RIJ24311.1 hypothetical protein D1224_08735 [Henriciella barbarensis]
MRRLFHFLALLGLFAYLANGAQAHLRIVPGETISIPICGDGLSRSIKIEVGGSHEDTSDRTCCGDCIVPLALPVTAPLLPLRTVASRVRPTQPVRRAGYPRSPLWPGAPPQGPPHFA